MLNMFKAFYADVFHLITFCEWGIHRDGTRQSGVIKFYQFNHKIKCHDYTVSPSFLCAAVEKFVPPLINRPGVAGAVQ